VKQQLRASFPLPVILSEAKDPRLLSSDFRSGGDTPASSSLPLVCHPERSEGSAFALSVPGKQAPPAGYCTGDRPGEGLKGWRRSKKIALIESMNAAWTDLSRDWYEYEPADYKRALDRMET